MNGALGPTRAAVLALIAAAWWFGLGLADAGAEAPGAEVELDRRVFEVARQLRCPVCVSESVADSNAQISVEMRTTIRELLREGRSEAEIHAFFQERYGDWILLEPPRRGIHLIVWWLPWLAAGVGAVALAVLAARWTAKARRPEEVEEGDLERVRTALRGDGEGEGG